MEKTITLTIAISFFVALAYMMLGGISLSIGLVLFMPGALALILALIYY